MELGVKCRRSEQKGREEEFALSTMVNSEESPCLYFNALFFNLSFSTLFCYLLCRVRVGAWLCMRRGLCSRCSAGPSLRRGQHPERSLWGRRIATPAGKLRCKKCSLL